MSRVIDRPQPGHYRIRLVKSGPWMPALIYRPCPMIPVTEDVHPDEWLMPSERSRILTAEIDGREVPMARVWLRARPVTLKDWSYLTDCAAWDRANDPGAAMANPRTPVDIDAEIRRRPPAF